MDPYNVPLQLHHVAPLMGRRFLMVFKAGFFPSELVTAGPRCVLRAFAASAFSFPVNDGLREQAHHSMAWLELFDFECLFDVRVTGTELSFLVPGPHSRARMSLPPAYVETCRRKIVTP